MALRYLLDTDTCIYIAKHNPPAVREKLARLMPGQVGMSAITFGELLFGAEKSTSKAKAIVVLKQLQQLVPVVDLDAETAQRYGEIRAALERAGAPIGSNDLWIAAQAKAKDLILVTNNVREFKRVRGLKIENWAV